MDVNLGYVGLTNIKYQRKYRSTIVSMYVFFLMHKIEATLGRATCRWCKLGVSFLSRVPDKIKLHPLEKANLTRDELQWRIGIARGRVAQGY